MSPVRFEYRLLAYIAAGLGFVAPALVCDIALRRCFEQSVLKAGNVSLSDDRPGTAENRAEFPSQALTG